MCGIAGLISIDSKVIPDAERRLGIMNALIAHRGPDGSGNWLAPRSTGGLTHRRLAIIDLSAEGAQPMTGESGHVITYNGEIYNYDDLRRELEGGWRFRSRSDTETILAAHARWGNDCVDHLRGMFAFAIHDGERLFAARDPFGIKPFHYAIVDNVFYFASEMKALLPFLPEIETDREALADYLSFQYQISDSNLFRHVKTLLPGHALKIENGKLRIWKYWDIRYEADTSLTAESAAEALEARLHDSIGVHMKSDVAVGAYVSGGIDSSLVAALSRNHPMSAGLGFHGKFAESADYDESEYAQAACQMAGIDLKEMVITSEDFQRNFARVIYHLDQPVAGPGSFPQYMVSQLAARHVKVVLGGQGGDELFGGYARYLIAYLEQALRKSVTGDSGNHDLPLSLAEISPSLPVLKEYKPLMQQLFATGLFGNLDDRYFRLTNRATDMQDEIDWQALDLGKVRERYLDIFNSRDVLPERGAMDAVTHFDFKCLLPALLQVEDRMSMAHGLEARVPILDREIVGFSASLPMAIKFPNGRLKDMLKKLARKHLPQKVFERRDKMGFPVPLREWYSGPLNDFVRDMFSDYKARTRPLFDNSAIIGNFASGSQFSRKTWALMSLETWHQQFHDRAEEYRSMLTANDIVVPDQTTSEAMQ